MILLWRLCKCNVKMKAMEITWKQTIKFKCSNSEVFITCIYYKVFTISNSTINQILPIRTYYPTDTHMVNMVTIYMYIMLDGCIMFNQQDLFIGVLTYNTLKKTTIYNINGYLPLSPWASGILWSTASVCLSFSEWYLFILVMLLALVILFLYLTIRLQALSTNIANDRVIFSSIPYL